MSLALLMLTPNAGKIPLSKLSSSWLLDDRDNVSSPFSWIFCFLQHSQQLFIKIPFPTMNEIPLCVCACVFFRVLGLTCFPRSQRRTTNTSSSNICEQNLLQSRETREFAVSYWKQHHHGKNLELEARNARGHEDSLSTKKHTHTHISNELHNYYNGGPTGHRKL